MLYRPNPDRMLITDDGSRIMELLGRVTTGDGAFSVAYIMIPAERGQPRRRNGFHELMLVIDGSCIIELAKETLHLEKGDVLDLPPDTPYAERGGTNGCVAWAVCWPAFSPDLVTWISDD